MYDAAPVRRRQPFAELPSVFERLAERQRRRARTITTQLVAERLAVEELHDQIRQRRSVGDGRFPEVVEPADVRVLELRDDLSLALETALTLWINGEAARIFTATLRESRVSRARQTSPIPPAPTRDDSSYGPRRTPGPTTIRPGLWHA